MPVSTRSYAIAAVSVIAIGLIATYGFVLTANGDPFNACRESRVAGGSGAIGGPFTLVDETGRTVTEAEVLTGPGLVYFGYTYCPDVCPADIARNAETVDALEEKGYQVTPVFISVDPARDTPEQLAEWTDYMHPRMIGLTGTPEQIQAAAAAYKAFFRVPEAPADDYYLVDHTTYTYFMLPDHGFVEFFNRESEPEAMADRIACFIDAAG